MAGAPFPLLCFHAMGFPWTLEESGNFQGRDEEKLGRWVCNGHCLGDVLEPGDQAPRWAGLSVLPSVRSPACRGLCSQLGQATHRPEWTAAPRARCTLGQQGS